ncbi:hypothetical protein VTI74DRAFT_9530 [Chaetomium olivicolor]
MASQETTQPKITLYWLNDSRAQRIAWLLEELGLQYDVKIFHRNADMQAPAELEKIHPLGKSPLVGITLPDPADASKQKQLVWPRVASLPKGQLGGETEEWTRCQYYLHYAEGSLMPPMLVALILSILQSPKIPFFIRPITSSVVDKMHASFLVPQMLKHLAFLESQLETSPGNGQYLCGEHLTTADILMSFPVQLAKQRIAGLSVGKGQGKIGDKFPKLWAYLKRLEQMPGYKRAEAKIKELEKKS